MARPLKLTPDVQAKICEAVRAGLPYSMAALTAGIGERTFYRWKARAESAPDGPFGQFWQALKEAEAEGAKSLVTLIKWAAQGTMNTRAGEVRTYTGSWQAAAWLLERRHPAEFGRRQPAEPPSTSQDSGVDTADSEVATLLRGARERASRGATSAE